MRCAAGPAGRVRALRSQRARDVMRAVLPGLLAALARQAQPDRRLRPLRRPARPPAGRGAAALAVPAQPGAARPRRRRCSAPPPRWPTTWRGTPQALEGLLRPAEAPGIARALQRAPRRRARPGGDASTSSAPPCAPRISPSRSPPWRAGSTPTPPARPASQLADAALAALLAARAGGFRRPLRPRARRRHGGGAARQGRLARDDGGLRPRPDGDLRPPGAASPRAAAPRRLPASQWFLRAVHAYVAALTAPDAVGPMYAVDMRLRPSGNKGPVAVSLGAFERYHAPGRTPGPGSAWR